jgi:transcriptional regulator GlxA family with amidase domain
MAVAPDQMQHDFVMFVDHGFSLMNMSGFFETLKIANQLLKFEKFTWSLCAADGAPVQSSCGVNVPVDTGLDTLLPRQTLILNIGANGVQNKSAIEWVRKTSHMCRFVGTLGNSEATLAKTGCLNQASTFSVHWREIDTLREQYPDQTFSRQPGVKGNKCFSASGSTAGIDLALCQIEESCGEAFVQRLADELNYTAQRKLQSLAGDNLPILSHIDNATLRVVISEMEDQIENAPNVQHFADKVLVSQRQLERLFQKSLNETPKKFFLKLRLDRARDLLLQTEMDVLQVAIATGFSSNGTFTKRFKERFGHAPRDLRALTEVAVPA